MKFSGKVGHGPVNKCLNFGGDPDQGYGYPYRDTGKMCFGEDVHCPSASSFQSSLLCSVSGTTPFYKDYKLPQHVMEEFKILAHATYPIHR